MQQLDVDNGLVMLPAAAWTLKPGTGMVAAEEAIAPGLAALAQVMDGGDVPRPDAFDFLRRTVAALCDHAHPDHAHLTAQWRGLLALCLLADAWTDGPCLSVETLAADTPLAAALLTRQTAPVRLVFLKAKDAPYLLGVASAEVGIIPAADASQLSDVLPDRVSWYSRGDERFSDPTNVLNERDRALLIRRLSAMKGGCAAPVAEFASALMQQGVKPAQAAARQEEAALRDLVIRVKAVAGLTPEKEFTALTSRTASYAPSAANPLLTALRVDTPSETDFAAPQTTWLWRGIPFARSSAALGLEPAGAENETAALDELAAQVALLECCSPRWRSALNLRLSEWLIGHGGPALSPAARKAVEEAKRQAAQMMGDAPAELAWPFAGDAARLIWRECLGEDWDEAMLRPFAEKICLLPGGSLTDSILARTCQLTGDGEAFAVLPPLSAALAKRATEELLPEKLRFAWTEGGAVCASLTLRGRRELVLRRVYAPGDIRRVSAEDVPTLAVWPAVPFAQDKWWAYYTYQHGGSLRARLMKQSAWVRTEDRLFSVVETERFPTMLAIFDDETCLGALPNLLPVFHPDRGDAAVVGLELGASGVAAALRQGLRAETVALPNLTRTLLLGGRPAPMANEFIPAAPIGPVLPAAVETFSREGDVPLVEGHILFGGAQSPELCCNLKWGTDSTSCRARRLHLHQTMLTASLAAALAGAPTIAWRLALPEDMTEQGRRAVWQTVEALAPLVAAHTGLPLAAEMPVSHGEASMALGTYHRGEGGIRGGFLSLDWGGASLSMALWLRGMNRPAVRLTLPLGVHVLLTELSPQSLLDDFAELHDPAARKCVTSLAESLSGAQGSVRAFHQAQYLLDVCLGEHLPALASYMNARYASGQMTRLQALLAATAAAAMAIAGLIQEQVWRDPLLNDYLPANMTLALAGRGSLLLNALPDVLRSRLTNFVRLMLTMDHPVHGLQLLPSAAPKAETVLGLVRLVEVGETQPGKAAALRPNAPLPLPSDGLIMRFLAALRFEMPEVYAAVYPAELFAADGCFTAEAVAMIQAIAARHFAAAASPEAAFAACLAEIRALP